MKSPLLRCLCIYLDDGISVLTSCFLTFNTTSMHTIWFSYYKVIHKEGTLWLGHLLISWCALWFRRLTWETQQPDGLCSSSSGSKCLKLIRTAQPLKAPFKKASTEYIFFSLILTRLIVSIKRKKIGGKKSVNKMALCELVSGKHWSAYNTYMPWLPSGMPLY